MDAIRGLAAIQVFTRHTRNMFFIDFPMVTSHRAVLAVPYLLSALGRQAVIIFFVLSGFLIGGSVIRAVENGTFHWGRYMSWRLTRLWVVLIPALLLTALWDHIGIASGRAPEIYNGGGLSLMTTTSIVDKIKFKTFFGTLFFQQGIHTNHFGSDGALWTLSLEFWYYILFIALCLAISNKTKTWLRIVYGLAVIGMSLFVGKFTMSMFPIWLFGVALLYVKPPKVTSKTRWLVTIPFFLLICFLSRSRRRLPEPT